MEDKDELELSSEVGSGSMGETTTSSLFSIDGRENDGSENTDDEMSRVFADCEGDGSEGGTPHIVDRDSSLSEGRTPGSGQDENEPVEGVEEEGSRVDRFPILWHSNAPWVGTGYGTQTGLFGPLLQSELDYDVAFSAFFGLQGRRLGWVCTTTGTPHTVYPRGKDRYGNDVLGAHAQHHFAGRRGLVVYLSDVWVLRAQAAAGVPMIAWCPVDHNPVIEDTVTWFQKSGAFPVAMSRFGEEQLKSVGIKNVHYVPHGFNGEIFKPASRAEARDALDLPLDAFIVGMVAANIGVPSRKSFDAAFQAFAEFKKTHSDAVLYLHTLLDSATGESLTAMADSLGIKPLACDQYGYMLGAPDALVATTCSAFDVLLNPAAGEGFGVPLIEAQACGTPCIVSDFSAMPEVAPFEAGNWLVGGQRAWTPFSSWQLEANVEEILVALESAYSETEDERTVRRVSVWKHAQQYEALRVTHEHWAPTLEDAIQEFAWRRKRMRRFLT